MAVLNQFVQFFAQKSMEIDFVELNNSKMRHS